MGKYHVTFCYINLQHTPTYEGYWHEERRNERMDGAKGGLENHDSQLVRVCIGLCPFIGNLFQALS